jgi:hypothetical protein
MPPKNTDNDHSTRAELHGSGALAQGEGAVSANGGGVAVGHDVHGDVIVVTYQGAQVTIPSPEAIAAHSTAHRKPPERHRAKCAIVVFPR